MIPKKQALIMLASLVGLSTSVVANTTTASPQKKSVSKSKVKFRDLNKNGKLDVYENSLSPREDRVQDLMNQMTLEEKVGQLAHPLGWFMYTKINDKECIPSDKYKSELKDRHIGSFWATLRADPWTQKTLKTGLNPELAAKTTNALQQFAQDSTRLGIPVMLAEECPHGHMAIGTTVFPTSIGQASTWNTELIKRMAACIAEEARLQGSHIGYGPVVDVARELRWSRVEETYGEDPVLNGKMGVALVEGFQGDNLNSGKNIAATLKHFTAYGVPEGGHNAGMAHAGKRELLSELTLPFEMSVKAGAKSLMTAYNEIDGIPCSANEYLLTEVLKNEWGFDGFVVSDLYAIDGLVSQRVASNKEEAAIEAINAGVDSDLGANCFAAPLVEAVKQGKVSMATVDSALVRVLRLKFDLGLFDNPYVDPKLAKANVNTQANKDLAREVAQQSIILLKNENDLLPLSKELKSIAVIGPNADMMYNQLGDYTSPQPDEAIVTVLEGIKNKLPKTKVNYVKGCAIRDTSHTEIAAAVEAAKESDVAIVVLGGSSARDFEVEFKETGAAIANANSKRLADMESGEGFDRVSLTLMGKQNELLEAVRATGKPVVVVMIQGRPLDISKAAETVPAILNAWYPGSEGGNAIADVLFGDYNPAGRLPISIPKTVGQLPVYYSSKEKSRHDYIESTAQPLYPFGYGLSYTNFTYGTPRIVVNETPDNVSVDVFVTVTNSGKKAGDEVVQLYLQDKKASVVLPYMQLKNFARVLLQPGESKEVKLTLGNDDLRLLNRDYKWVVEAGEFEAMIGAASNDIRQTTTFNVKNNYQLSKPAPLISNK